MGGFWGRRGQTLSPVSPPPPPPPPPPSTTNLEVEVEENHGLLLVDQVELLQVRQLLARRDDGYVHVRAVDGEDLAPAFWVFVQGGLGFGVRERRVG
jgi:hypothetical protein